MRNTRVLFVAGWAHRDQSMRGLSDSLSNTVSKELTSVSTLAAQRTQAPTSQFDKEAQLSRYALGLKETCAKIEEELIIIAWSMGAIVTLELLSYHTVPIRTCILLSATQRFCADDFYTCGVPAQNVRALRIGLTRRPHKTLKAFFHDASYPHGTSDVMIDSMANEALTIENGLLVDGLHYLEQVDLRDTIKNIQIPIHLIHGEQDKIVPLAAGEELHKALPQCTMQVIPDVGHALPNVFSESITPSLKRIVEEERI